MGILVGGFLVLFGVVWTGISLVVARGAATPHAPAQINILLHSMTGLGVVILVIGALMLITGLIRAKQKRKLALEIFQRGTLVKGNVTFVDKDYSLLVNNKPIYSIVEFTFQDSAGKTHTSRKTGVNSDLVIRDRIEVGGQVAVKYLPENPEVNILLLQDPTAGGASASA
jgi:hypothetical protein